MRLLMPTGRSPDNRILTRELVVSEAADEVGRCVFFAYLLWPCAFDIGQDSPNLARIQLVFIGGHVAVHAGGRKDSPTFADKIIQLAVGMFPIVACPILGGWKRAIRLLHFPVGLPLKVDPVASAQ